MKCKFCDKEVNVTSRFCNYCGAKIDKRSSSLNDRLFGGRLNRRNYFFGIILLYLAILSFDVLFVVVVDILSGTDKFPDSWSGILTVFNYFVMGIYGLSFGIRRAHDINHKGSYILWTIVPIASIIVGIDLLFSKGKDKPNKYGISPEPKVDLKDIFAF